MMMAGCALVTALAGCEWQGEVAGTRQAPVFMADCDGNLYGHLPEARRALLWQDGSGDCHMAAGEDGEAEWNLPSGERSSAGREEGARGATGRDAVDRVKTVSRVSGESPAGEGGDGGSGGAGGSGNDGGTGGTSTEAGGSGGPETGDAGGAGIETEGAGGDPVREHTGKPEDGITGRPENLGPPPATGNSSNAGGQGRP